MALKGWRQMSRLMGILLAAGGFQEWIENMTDQSHVSWAHHSAAGNRCVLPACATPSRNNFALQVPQAFLMYSQERGGLTSMGM